MSWLNYAFRLMQLPIGIFGVAVATVTLTAVSHHAAQKEIDKLAATVASSLTARRLPDFSRDRGADSVS